MRRSEQVPAPGGRANPDVREVHDLIRRAEEHPLGLGYLQEGFQDSVAATFGVSAFVVDAARERLRVEASQPR